MLKYLVILLLVFRCLIAYPKVYTVKIGFGNQFITPTNLEVSLGDTVRFVNFGTYNTSTSGAVPYNARSWDVELKAFRSHYDLKMEVDGTYEFYSQTHPQHRGIIHVKNTTVPSKPYVTQSPQHEFFDFYIGYPLSGEVEVKIYDLLGKLLIEKRIIIKQGRGQFNSKFINKGIYFFKVYHEYKQVFFYKFLKE